MPEAENQLRINFYQIFQYIIFIIGGDWETGKVPLLSVFGECDHIWLEKEIVKALGQRRKVGAWRNIESVIVEC